MNGLSGKRILVTGASSGIGRACALRLSAAGAFVIAAGRNESRLHELGIASGSTQPLDLLDETAVKAFVQRLKADAAPLDGCILAAGLHTFRPMMMESYQDILKPWASNVQGNLGLLAQLLKARLLGKNASIVLFSSAAAHKAGAGAVSYAASKGAIESATHALALELAAQRIRVNAVAAGVVRTPMSEGFLNKLSAGQLAALEVNHPLGFGTPEDVAGPVLFLLSDEARWITGAVIAVDGGYSVA